MNKIDNAIASGDLENLQLILQTSTSQSIISYLHMHLSDVIDHDVLIMLLDNMPIRNNLGNWLKVCLSDSDLNINPKNIEIMINHLRVFANNDINKYIKVKPEIFQLFLESNKFKVDGNTLDLLLNDNHPDKIKAYLISDKFIPLSNREVANLTEKYFVHSYSLSLILRDNRSDLSLISKKTLQRCLINGSLLSVLNERIPEIMEPLIKHKEESDIKRKQHIHKDIFSDESS